MLCDDPAARHEIGARTTSVATGRAQTRTNTSAHSILATRCHGHHPRTEDRDRGHPQHPRGRDAGKGEAAAREHVLGSRRQDGLARVLRGNASSRSSILTASIRVDHPRTTLPQRHTRQRRKEPLQGPTERVHRPLARVLERPVLQRTRQSDCNGRRDSQGASHFRPPLCPGPRR